MNNDYSKEASALRRKAGEGSLLKFATLYLPHHIQTPPSQKHLEIYKQLLAVQRSRNAKVAIAAPRDFGKTTMISLVWVLYSICYGREDFIVLMSHTSSQAIRVLENIRKEFLENERIRMDFKELFDIDYKKRKSKRWTNADIVTQTGIEILALGYGQQIRGRKYGATRPSLVILDDLEPGENTLTYESKEKMRAWLNQTLLKAGCQDANYLFIGNIFNSLSLLGEIINKEGCSSWTKIKLRALEQYPANAQLWEQNFHIANNKDTYQGENGLAVAKKHYLDNKAAMDEGAVLLWPQRWSIFDLMHEKNEDPISFASERQNEPVDMSALSVNVEDFHYWTDRFANTEALLEHLGQNVFFVAACDPSTGKHALKGDYSAIVILACQGKFRYIIEADIARPSIDLLIPSILAYCQRYQFSKFAIEANGFQDLIVRELKGTAMEMGIRTEFVPITNMKDKIGRGQAVLPMTKNGYLQYSKMHRMLLDQWSVWPSGKHDDGIDALEMAARFAAEVAASTIPPKFLSLVKKQLQPVYASNDHIGDLLHRMMRGNDGMFGGSLAKLK